MIKAGEEINFNALLSSNLQTLAVNLLEYIFIFFSFYQILIVCHIWWPVHKTFH